MPKVIVNPPWLPKPSGYSHGIEAQGRTLYVAGQVGWDSNSQLVSDRFIDQFDQALANVLTVVTEAGGSPESIARLTIYVVDKADYAAKGKEIGAAYRRVLGKRFPAMALLEVKSLLEPRALVEIEATAVIGGA